MKPVTVFDSGAKPDTPNEGSVFVGLAIGVVLNLLQAGLVFLVGDQFDGGGEAGLGRGLMILIVGLGGAGLIQLIYIVPLYFFFKRKEKTQTAKGLVIAASLVILINAICWGAFGPH